MAGPSRPTRSIWRWRRPRSCSTGRCSGEDATLLETLVKRPGQPLPSIDELNAKIPEKEWAIGFDNKPRPPWQKSHVVYLLAESSAERFTYLNSTIGARIAVENLRDKVRWMRALRGESVVPRVKLGSAPMRTRFGGKLRPDFEIASWVELGVEIRSEQSAEPRLEQAAAPRVEQAKPKRGAMPVKPVSYAEALNDEIPD
jgi:hypothetical protein